MSRGRILVWLTMVSTLAGTGPALAGGILDRYADNGCVIAPDAARPEQAQRALSNGMAVERAGWLALGPEVCTMTPPSINAVLKPTDPDVAPYISAVDAYPEAPGCFLDAQGMQRAVMQSRGWSDERAYIEYIRLIGAGIFTGEWRFFGDSPLATPLGFQLTTGECGDVPYVQDMRASHANMIESFDPYIRINAPYIACELGAQFDNHKWAALYSELDQGAILNAWHAFEVTFALMGSDWIEGVSLRGKGTPRPPICVPSQAVIK